MCRRTPTTPPMVPPWTMVVHSKQFTLPLVPCLLLSPPCTPPSVPCLSTSIHVYPRLRRLLVEDLGAVVAGAIRGHRQTLGARRRRAVGKGAQQLHLASKSRSRPQRTTAMRRIQNRNKKNRNSNSIINKEHYKHLNHLQTNNKTIDMQVIEKSEQKLGGCCGCCGCVD